MLAGSIGPLATSAGLLLVLFALACSPVGSDSWCEDMKEKSKGDWSANELADFSRHCVFK